MTEIAEVLLERLRKKGVEPGIIPTYLRSIANFLQEDPDAAASKVNLRLHRSGWDGFELDDQTLQLAIACLESGGLQDMFRRGLAFPKNRLNG